MQQNTTPLDTKGAVLAGKIERLRKRLREHSARRPGGIAAELIARVADKENFNFSLNGELCDAKRIGDVMPLIAWHAINIHRYIFPKDWSGFLAFSRSATDPTGFRVDMSSLFPNQAVCAFYLLEAYYDIAEFGPRSGIHPGSVDFSAIAEMYSPQISQVINDMNALRAERDNKSQDSAPEIS